MAKTKAKTGHKVYNMTTRYDVDLYLALQKAARREKSDISKVVRRILRKDLLEGGAHGDKAIAS